MQAPQTIRGVQRTLARASDSAIRARPAIPRIPPLPASQRTGTAAELLGATPLPAANVFTTLVRTPDLFAAWVPFGKKLLYGSLPGRDRELLVLRTAWNCQAEYEWAQHVALASVAGLSQDETVRIAARGLDGWPPWESTLIRAADELHDDSCIGDTTWTELAERYDTQQLIEVPMLVGHYQMVAMTLNSLGVQLDPGLRGFPW